MNLFCVTLFGLLIVVLYLEYQSNGNAGLGARALKDGIAVPRPFDIIPRRMLILSNILNKEPDLIADNCVRGSGVIVDKFRILTGAKIQEAISTVHFKRPSYNRADVFVGVTRYIKHPKFLSFHDMYDMYDIGLIKLRDPLDIYVNTPIFMGLDLPKNAGVVVRVYGYGRDEHNKLQLMYAEFVMIHAVLCKELYHYIEFHNEHENSFFCIPHFGDGGINLENTAGVESIDFGAAVTIKDPRDNGKEKLVGIIAHTKEAKIGGKYQILFTKVQSVAHNIKSIDDQLAISFPASNFCPNFEMPKTPSGTEKPAFKYFQVARDSKIQKVKARRSDREMLIDCFA